MAFAHVASGRCASSALCAALASSATHRSVAEQPGGAEKLQESNAEMQSCTSAAVIAVVLSCASCSGSSRGGGRFESPWP